MTDTLDVIYVVRNALGLLQASMQSLPEQIGASSMRTIIIDNGSDPPVTHAERWHLGHLLTVSLTPPVGFGAANNIGMKHATSDYVLLLNTDTVVHASLLPAMWNVMENNATCGCVGARHLNTDGTLQRSMDSFPNLVADFLTLTGLHSCKPVWRYLAKRHAWWSPHDVTREVDWVNGACMLVRRRAYEDVGGFDEEYTFYGEEIDLCFRLKAQGWTTIFTSEGDLTHIGGGSTLFAADDVLFRKMRALLMFYDKHCSLAERLSIRLIALLPLIGKSLHACWESFTSMTSGNKRQKVNVAMLEARGWWQVMKFALGIR